MLGLHGITSQPLVTVSPALPFVHEAALLLYSNIVPYGSAFSTHQTQPGGLALPLAVKLLSFSACEGGVWRLTTEEAVSSPAGKIRSLRPLTVFLCPKLGVPGASSQLK